MAQKQRTKLREGSLSGRRKNAWRGIKVMDAKWEVCALACVHEETERVVWELCSCGEHSARQQRHKCTEKSAVGSVIIRCPPGTRPWEEIGYGEGVTRTTTKRTTWVRGRAAELTWNAELLRVQSHLCPLRHCFVVKPCSSLPVSSCCSFPACDAALPSCFTPNQPGKLEVIVSSLYFSYPHWPYHMHQWLPILCPQAD